MLKIALIAHSTRSDNMGVGALTVADIDILRRAAERAGTSARFLVVDWTDRRDPYVTGPDIEIRPIRARDILKPWGYARLIADADMVVDIGGGDSFADIYGGARLRRMMAMKYIAHGLRRPFVMAPQTVGPFRGATACWFAARSMALSRIVATRDDISARIAREMGRADLVEASDVALRLPYTPPPPGPPPRADGAGEQDGPPRVGLNVSGLLMAGGYTRDNMFGLRLDYPALMRAVIGDFLAARCELHLVAHVITHRGGVEDDLSASETLAAEFPGVQVAPAFATPSEAKSFIAGLDFFAGARMHACIAAFSAGVPVVPLAYSRKFAGLFGSLGYERTFDCTAQDAGTIRAGLMQAFADRATLAAEIDTARAEGLRRLQRYEDALVELMRALQGLEQFDGSAPGALVQPETDRYQLFCPLKPSVLNQTKSTRQLDQMFRHLNGDHVRQSRHAGIMCRVSNTRCHIPAGQRRFTE